MIMHRLYGNTWPSVRAAFIEYSHPLEGTVPWLYQDVKGLITCGTGILVDPLAPWVMALPFVHLDGSPATPADIAADWRRVKGRPELAQHGAMAAKQWCKLRLTPEGVEALTMRKFDEFAAYLAKRYAGFSTWPADAQLSCMSMAWACGPAWGGIFKTLEQACIGEDWLKAADHCEINSKGNPGVIPRSKLQRKLFQNAVESVRLGMMPEHLIWPHEPPAPEAA